MWSVSFSRRIMSDAQADQLIAAANNIKYIPVTSRIVISMKQIYDRIPDRAIFEQVRDDIQNGVIVMKKIGELGFVVTHTGQRSFNLYAVINGRRYEAGAIDALAIPALATKLTPIMLSALRAG